MINDELYMLAKRHNFCRMDSSFRCSSHLESSHAMPLSKTIIMIIINFIIWQTKINAVISTFFLNIPHHNHDWELENIPQFGKGRQNFCH